MLFQKSTFAAALVAATAAVPLAVAQTFTDCDPTKKTCPNDTGLESTTFSSDFTTGSSAAASWSAAAGTTITYGSDGAEFKIAAAGQAPTIQTNFYIFFGKIDVVMQAAPGTGIVSSIVLESDDLDEIDLEFLGGDTTQVETNYFGKGNTTTYDRAIYYPVSSPQTTFHTYTIDWTPSYINFAIDGAVVRTITYEEAVGGKNFPQTPMRLKLGNWAGGAQGNAAGTIEWAGGATDFSQGPFSMYVKSVSVSNTNPASAYQWTDQTGSYQSIKVIKGDGSSASAGNSTRASTDSDSSSSSSSSATVTSDSKTNAPTSTHSVAAVMQTNAAESSTSSGAAPSTTVASLMSSSVPKKSVVDSKGSTSIQTTLSSVVLGSSSAPASTESTSNGAPEATGSASSAAANSSQAASSVRDSKSSAGATGSTATMSSSLAVQTANSAASYSVTTTFVVLCSVTSAWMATM